MTDKLQLTLINVLLDQYFEH